MIESCGDTLDESHMPLGWPLSIDGAVRQFSMHKHATIEELNDMLAEFNLQRSSVEINRYHSVVAQFSMQQKVYGPLSRPHSTAAMGRLRTLHLPKGIQVQRGARRSNTPNGPGIATPRTGQPSARASPPQNAALTRRAQEEWERTICENKAVSILEQLQEGRPPPLPKGWRSDANSDRLGSAAAGGARPG